QAVIKSALDQKVDEHRFLLKLGESQIEAKQYDEAEKSLKRALEKKPKLQTAWYNLGLVYEEKGMVPEAIAAYEAELAQNEKAYRAAFNVAKLLQKAGRLDEAVARYPKAARARHELGPGQPYLARALLDCGDLRGAEEWARRGLVTNPDPHIAPLGHFVLADVFNRQGRLAEAEREAAAARRLERGS